MKMAMLDPPPGPSWSYTMFEFDKDPERVVRAAANLNPRNPDLSALKKRGGRSSSIQVGADQQVNPFPGIEYYETVSKRMGDKATRDFYRLFMVPGMFPLQWRAWLRLSRLALRGDDWVEKGKAPEQLIGSHSRTAAPRAHGPLAHILRWRDTRVAAVSMRPRASQ
jgi:feruloyl esterase